jgi:hypothetical protein
VLDVDEKFAIEDLEKTAVNLKHPINRILDGF